MYWRKASTAAVAASALRAAAVEPRGPTSPASIAPIGGRAIPQIGAASAPPCAWPQQSMLVSSRMLPADAGSDTQPVAARGGPGKQIALLRCRDAARQPFE